MYAIGTVSVTSLARCCATLRIENASHYAGVRDQLLVRRLPVLRGRSWGRRRANLRSFGGQAARGNYEGGRTTCGGTEMGGGGRSSGRRCRARTLNEQVSSELSMDLRQIPPLSRFPTPKIAQMGRNSLVPRQGRIGPPNVQCKAVLDGVFCYGI